MSGAAEYPAAIIGGGIGGLAAAPSLEAAGFAAHVFEQAASLGEVGAGIQIGPNASRLLMLRLPRASRLQALSLANKTRFHLADGPPQQHAQLAGNGDRSIPALHWLYAHDAGAIDTTGLQG